MIRLTLTICAGIFCVASAGAFAGAAQDGASEDRAGPEEGTEFRLTGKKRYCLRNVDIKWMIVVDHNTLLFHTRDGAYYFNNMIRCGINKNYAGNFTFYAQGEHNYCCNDAVRGAGAKCILRMYEEAVIVEDKSGAVDNETGGAE